MRTTTTSVTHLHSAATFLPPSMLYCSFLSQYSSQPAFFHETCCVVLRRCVSRVDADAITMKSGLDVVVCDPAKQRIPQSIIRIMHHAACAISSLRRHCAQRLPRVMRRAIRRNVAGVTSMQYDTFDTHGCAIDRSSGARSELVPNKVLR
jgi:hypothetical protein